MTTTQAAQGDTNAATAGATGSTVTGNAGAGEAAATKTGDAGSTATAASTTTATTAETKTATTGTEAKAAEVQAELTFKLPDGVVADEALQTEFKAIAKESGLKSEGAQKLIDLLGKAQGRWTESLEQHRADQSRRWIEEAKTDKDIGGEGFGKNLEVAQKAIAQFARPELKAFLVESGLGNHPEMIRFCNAVGKALGEPTVAGTTGSGGLAAPSDKDRLQALYPNSPEMFQSKR